MTWQIASEFSVPPALPSIAYSPKVEPALGTGLPRVKYTQCLWTLGWTLPSKDFDNFLPYPLSFRVEIHIGLRGSQSPQSTEWWKEDQKVFSEGSLMEDGNSHRLGRDCRLELGWGWEDGREKLREEVMDFIKSLIWLSGSCTQTYLICSVVKSMEAQVPLRKCRCWTQAEEEKVTSVCADPQGLGDTLRQGWG